MESVGEYCRKNFQRSSIIRGGGRGRKGGWQQAFPGAKVEAARSSAPGNYLIRK